MNRLRDDSFGDSVYKSALFRATVACDIASVRLLLKAGARINERDYLARNSLEYGITRKQKIAKDLHLLLYAAGETLEGPTVPTNVARMYVNIPKYFTELKENLDLKHLCRAAIRKHLIDLDPHEHLFLRIPQLGFPSILTEYMLINCSIDSDDETDDEED